MNSSHSAHANSSPVPEKQCRAKRLSCVLLDRDGVLNTHLPGAYVRTPDELVVLDGVAGAIRRLNDARIPVVIISNQQGVGKGLMTPADLDEVDQALRRRLAEQAGAHIDRSLYCPHLKEEACDCRKPLPGLIHQALHELHISASETVFVGDSETDIQAAEAAGVGCKILVLSGGTESYKEGLFRCGPDRVFKDLAAAVNWLLALGVGE